MRKSLYAIGGMGLGACLLLSFMMQHLLQVRQDHPHSALAAELEALLGGKLVGRATTSTELSGDKVVTTVRFDVLAGLNRQRIVADVGPFLWQRLAAEPSLPQQLHFVVGDDAGSEPETVDLPRPRLAMPQGGTPAANVGTPPAKPASPAKPATPPPAPVKR